jgi:hypothetical protein
MITNQSIEILMHDVYDEVSNLNTLITTLTSVVFYSALQLACPFIRLCFTHTMLKATQYANNDF